MRIGDKFVSCNNWHGKVVGVIENLGLGLLDKDSNPGHDGLIHGQPPNLTRGKFNKKYSLARRYWFVYPEKLVKNLKK